ncbi:Predicted dithiol-disulfide oxidoreductase, DUF899 family [Actinopolymorpha cephalotaxi]|uniref:Dithiol-disulfide oxidoreductase (DUF899 family) n=1 Tax=Actinopolymorpha cephalotaxi TaxID=504797 RepID=A0A1I2S7P6_9ACTN|nr:DUF899 family protein [Actinopolymorpha cephalotaxi]NYH87081.1 putative dithiol-disulfide oxidoreductase (DUF899 family) [Actinopolymorpha cephalotaxi]SFG48838.1 Predicted dithiol-disulfide oxidoreductase, DUF899 family [Actinopolymorpha cephalotaxi]
MTTTPKETPETTESARPRVVDRATYQAEREALLVREKAHTHEGDALAADRRRLPMVEVDPTITVVGEQGPVSLLEVFEGREQLIAYFHMWHHGHSAAGQCEGCTFFNGQVRELAYLHSRDVTYATLCQGPYDVSVRYRDFMGWGVPWYSARDSLDVLLGDRPRSPAPMVCYLRQGSRVFETYWTTGRGLEAMDNTYGLLDLTVHGRREGWQDTPDGWPDPRWAKGADPFRTNGRPIAQWPRIQAGRSDDLGESGNDGAAAGDSCCH